jgi:glycosyltransferase involved in cell wall biosynthesis/SAM-dependent methyltransferase
MIFLNAERFMEEAIASVYAQTYTDWELILVDDGSTDASTAIALRHVEEGGGQVRYAEHDGHVNRGMSPSRNHGIHQARGQLIAFLDADDVWEPAKLEEQVAILTAEPRAAAVFGAPLYWRRWNPDEEEGSDDIPGLGCEAGVLIEPPALSFSLAPLGEGPVPCPSDVMVRREAVSRVGGFEPRFRGAYEDTAFFVKLFLREPVITADRQWTRYRLHPDSCMALAVKERRYQSIRLFFLNWFEEYLSRHGLAGTASWTRLQERLLPFRTAHSLLAMSHTPSSASLSAAPNPVPIDSNATTISWSIPDGSVGQVWVSQDGGHETLFGQGSAGSQTAEWINPGVKYEFRLYSDETRSRLIDTVTVARLVDAGVGGESFGSLRRVVPLSRTFGFDRGQPIDRYYIDQFLQRHRSDVSGHVLEIGESTYTRRFGGEQATTIDVLHVEAGNPEATIIDDLAVGSRLQSNTVDCILLIQTLHLIFDVAAAIRTVERILKPGGVVLATFPGLSQVSRDEWRDCWYWGFTRFSAERLFGDVFRVPPEVETMGNVLAASAFLYGLASSELTRAELDYVDESYETLIAVRAVKSHP